MIKTTIERAEELRHRITRHDQLYYALQAPEISDRQYDELYQALQALEREHPECRDPDSPTQRVGGEVAAGFTQVEHPEPMLSLASASSEEEFMTWHRRMADWVRTSRFPMSAELKIDGIAVRLIYEGGRLRTGATRGDGQTGEDVTHTIRTVRNIPLVLAELEDHPVPANVEARGEIYMPRSAFDRVNQERAERGEYTYANPRNAAAGAVRQLDPKEAAGRGLMAWVYSRGQPDTDSHLTSLEELKELGLPVNPANRLYCSAEEVISFYHRMLEQRDQLDYETDGIVVKMDLLPHQQMLGATGHEPRWATAWKFPSEQTTTKLMQIQISHGRFGRLTPVAVLEPVTVGGVTVQSASLHNEEDIHRKDIRAGDTVVIERAGDVIPQVSGPADPDRSRNTPVFFMPVDCPSCHHPVRTREDEIGHWCPNDECPSLLPEQLRHFVSASMGPPPFSDGNHPADGRHHRLRRASMGPPPFSDGNSYADPADRRAFELQWGHRLSAMEIRRRPVRRSPRRRFNGAIAFQRWKSAER